MRTLFTTRVLAAAAAAAVFFALASPGDVRACGGLFCATTATPIDQSGERVVFQVHDDGTITAVIQIDYTGDADEFSWIIPLPSVATVGTAPGGTLDGLDWNTIPIVAPPNCGGEDCAGARRVGFFSRVSAGEFEAVQIAGESADTVVRWLRDNGYRVTEDMEPFVASYVAEGSVFLALSLRTEGPCPG